MMIYLDDDYAQAILSVLKSYSEQSGQNEWHDHFQEALLIAEKRQERVDNLNKKLDELAEEYS